MLENGDQQMLDLVDDPEAPLGDQRLLLQGGSPQGTAHLLRQVEVDRKGFVENESVVIQHRYLSVGIELQNLRRAVWPAMQVGLDPFDVQAEFLGQPVAAAAAV